MAGRAFTVATLAEHWGVSDTFVYDRIGARELQAFKLGGKLWRIRPEAVEDYECRQTIECCPSDASGRTAPPIDTGRSSGLMNADRTASRLARMTARPQKLALVHSGPREL